MLTSVVFRNDEVEHHDDVDALIGLVGDESTVLWVDSTGPEEGDLERATALFGLHELAVEDVRKHGQRAKLHHYRDHSFVVVYARAPDGDLSEVDIFIGRNWVFTVRERNDHGEMLDLATVKERIEERRDLDVSAGAVLYALLDAVVDDYFQAVDDSEDRLEQVEDTLFREGPPPDGSLQEDLLDIRRDLITFRRRVVPLRDVVLAILRGEIDGISREALVYYEDVLDHLLRVIDQIDVQRELVGNVVDASLAISGNRMNQVMKKMTSWGAILIVATLVAGIYGMNFRHMPELDWSFGYPGVLLVMVAICAALFAYFKRIEWL